MIAKIKLNGKIVEIQDIEKAEGIKKFLGLMFKPQNTNALLFQFSKPVKTAIHSLFCPKFLAIWLDDKNKIVEYAIVNKAKMSIKPSSSFTKLLEIPLNNKYSRIFKNFQITLGKEKI